MSNDTRATIARSIPTQHGAWATLAASYVIGAFALTDPGVETLLIAVPILAAFLGRQALARARRLPGDDGRRMTLFTWVGLCALVSVAVTLLLAVRFDRWLLFPIGAGALGFISLSLEIESRRMDRTTAGEFIGMLGLCAATPATAYAASGEMGSDALILWAITAMFFGGSVFRVRYQVRERKARSGGLARRAAAGLTSLGYHVGAVWACLAFGLSGMAPYWEFSALVPAAIAVVWLVTVRSVERAPIRRIGFEELAHSIIFMAVTLIVYRGTR